MQHEMGIADGYAGALGRLRTQPRSAVVQDPDDAPQAAYAAAEKHHDAVARVTAEVLHRAHGFHGEGIVCEHCMAQAALLARLGLLVPTLPAHVPGVQGRFGELTDVPW